jgi:hypothetical protein
MLTSLNVIIFTEVTLVTTASLLSHPARQAYSRTVTSQSEGRTTGVPLIRVVRTVRVIPVFFYISNIIYCLVQRHATSVLVGLVTEVKLAVIRDKTRDSARSTDRKSVSSG